MMEIFSTMANAQAAQTSYRTASSTQSQCFSTPIWEGLNVASAQYDFASFDPDDLLQLSGWMT